MKLLYVTAPAGEQAEALARALIDARLAACVNLLPAGQSFFRWEGQVQQEAEHVLIVKTTEDKAEEAIGMLERLHPYDCPAILMLDVEGGHDPFLQWVGQETT